MISGWFNFEKQVSVVKSILFAGHHSGQEFRQKSSCGIGTELREKAKGSITSDRRILNTRGFLFLNLTRAGRSPY